MRIGAIAGVLVTAGMGAMVLAALAGVGSRADGALATKSEGVEMGRADEEAVRQAVLDYADAFYLGEPERIGRAVRPDARKIGFARRGEATEYAPMSQMTYDEMLRLAGTLRAGGRVPDGATREVEIFDIADQTASAKLTAFWGIDYFRLAKFEGQWRIVNVLWQSTPVE